jgi:hypothetical protein
MVGDYIQKKSKTPEVKQFEFSPRDSFEENPASISQTGSYQMFNGLHVAGVAMILIGFCWDMVFPVNKIIWTISPLDLNQNSFLQFASLLYSSIRDHRAVVQS